jgi:hypothetical protein
MEYLLEELIMDRHDQFTKFKCFTQKRYIARFMEYDRSFHPKLIMIMPVAQFLAKVLQPVIGRFRDFCAVF